ncbi:hypothetical protein AMTRI_Chr03g50440 [Amborella trichopoda]
MAYQAPVKKKKKWSYFKKKNYILQKIKNHLFFFLSKISSSIFLPFQILMFLSLSKISKIKSTISSGLSKSYSSSKNFFLYKTMFPKFVPSYNEGQWFLCPSPALSFFNTLTTKIIYSKDHSVRVHENTIGIIVKPPFYFMLLGLLLSYYGRKL